MPAGLPGPAHLRRPDGEGLIGYIEERHGLVNLDSYRPSCRSPGCP